MHAVEILKERITVSSQLLFNVNKLSERSIIHG